MQSRQDKSTGQVEAFDYTSQNQLVSIKTYPDFNSTVATKEVKYYYGPFGRRLAKEVVDYSDQFDPQKTYKRAFGYDGQEIIAEWDQNQNLLARYTHSSLRTDDVLSATITSSGVTAGLAQTSGTYY